MGNCPLFRRKSRIFLNYVVGGQSQKCEGAAAVCRCAQSNGINQGYAGTGFWVARVGRMQNTVAIENSSQPPSVPTTGARAAGACLICGAAPLSVSSGALG